MQQPARAAGGTSSPAPANQPPSTKPIWRRGSPAVRWGLLVAAAALLLAALNVWWFETYRRGYPFDIDEAGYTAFGLVDYLGLHYGGLHGWWDAIQEQGTFAPLAPALTSVLVSIKPGLMNGFATLTGFFVVLVMAAYGIGNRLAGPRIGAFAALVTATTPGAIIFSREYIFALPTAAMLACAVYGLIQSDGLRRRGWSIASGAALGLMLLARTMAISYVPGVLLAAAVAAVLRGRHELSKRALNLVLLIVTGVAVAATWYARNLHSVVDYLTSYGYGKQSTYYGRHNSLVSAGRLRGVGERIVSEDLFVPLGIAVIIGLGVLAVLVARRLRKSEDRGAEARRLLASDPMTVAIVIVVGYAALMSSRNGGDGFTLPISMLLPVLAAIALKGRRALVAPAMCVVALICALNTLSLATVWSTASRTRTVSVPGFTEAFPLTKGVPKAVFAIRLQIPGPETVFDSNDERWVAQSTRLAERLTAMFSPAETPVVGFASRNRVLNTNTVNLAALVKYHRAFPMVQLEAEPTDSASTYEHQIRHAKPGEPSALITMNRNTGDYDPLVNQAYAEQAARHLGFRMVGDLPLPNGRQARIWRKTGQDAEATSKSTTGS